MAPGVPERRTHTYIRNGTTDIVAFIEAHNENPKPYRWTKSADEILASVKRFCQKTMRRTSDSGD
jgi:putative transposase